MYAYGATAALLLSFLVFGYFVSAGHAQTDRPPRDVTSRLRPLRRVIPVLQGLSVFVLLLCIVTGLFGSRDPYRRSEEHTSELQSLMRISYAVFCLKQTKLQSISSTKHHNPLTIITL